jgi:transposase
MAKQTREQLRAEARRLRADNQRLHAIIRTQQQEIQGLSERIGKLEEALADARRAGKRQAAPFRRRERKTAPKRPGRRPGQGPFTRREPPSEDEIDRVVDVPLTCCPDCGGTLVAPREHEQIHSELPLPRPVHTRFITHSGYCPQCRRRVRSRHADQVSTATGAAGVALGPNAIAVSADLHHRLGVPYAKIADHFQTAFGLRVTPGGLCQAHARLAERAEPVYVALIEAIRACVSVHADETGWRIGVLSAWLWVFTGQDTTVYVIDESRGHEVVLEVLGREFPGILVSDCFVAYDHHALAEWFQQKCLAHLLETLSQMQEDKTGAALTFPREVTAVLREALELRGQKPTLSEAAFQRRLKRIEEKLDTLIDPRRRLSDPDNRRFAKRLRKQRDRLFTFLVCEGVDATNNAGERALRPSVVVRKTGACNKTVRGARTHSVLSSILVTLKQRGSDLIAYIASILKAPNTPPPLPARAAGPDP